MRCPECQAFVPDGAEFCPHCGTPMNSVLRERRATQASEDVLGNRRRTLFMTVGAFIAGVLIGGDHFPSFNFDLGHHRSEERLAVVDAQQLFKAYQDDEDEADDRYGDRPLVVRGEFLKIVNDGHGDPDIRFKTSDLANPLGADLQSNSFHKAENLQPGEIVTVSCEHIAQTGDEHWLQGCSIEQVEPGTSTPAPPQPPAPIAPPAAPKEP